MTRTQPTKHLSKFTNLELVKAIEVLYGEKLDFKNFSVNAIGYHLPNLLEAHGIRISGAQEPSPNDRYNTTGIYRSKAANADHAAQQAPNDFPDSHAWRSAAKMLIFKKVQSLDIDLSTIKDAMVSAYAAYGLMANAKRCFIGYSLTLQESEQLLEAWTRLNPPPSGISRWTGYSESTECRSSDLTTAKQWETENQMELNPTLTSYRVMLNEEAGDRFKVSFDCMATDADDAADQADQAYPGSVIISTFPFDASPIPFVIYSPNESAISDGAGYWNNQLGWVEREQATNFTPAEKATLNLPLSSGNDAHWVSSQDQPAPPLQKTASELAARYGHTSVDSNTTLKTEVNPDASDGHDEMMDLNVYGIGDKAYFEWATEYGDPIGDVFYTLEISNEDLPEVACDDTSKGDTP